jgi:hypothetical protein
MGGYCTTMYGIEEKIKAQIWQQYLGNCFDQEDGNS